MSNGDYSRAQFLPQTNCKPRGKEPASGDIRKGQNLWDAGFSNARAICEHRRQYVRWGRILMESSLTEAWSRIGKTVAVFVVAFIAGALIFLWMFEAAFSNASPSVYDAWIFPLAVLFGACLLLVLIEPN